MNFSKKYFFYAFFLLFSINCLHISAQNSDDLIVESNIYDVGKMWTFDFPPTNYLKENYNFDPNEEWFEDVRLSALRIPGCTASFVSENGLIMTNNHCSDGHKRRVEKEGENLADSGFYAVTLDEERKVPGMYAEQLAFIIDVTDEVNQAVDSADTEKGKIENKERIRKELVERYNEETGLKCQFVSLFNGGKYSVYGYRRFEDVRLVFVPENSIGYFGGDLDNFTYPRYNLDCAFFRVYDDEGNPVKSDNYYKFSNVGVQKDEVIFSVGNPGRTNRLHTLSQIEYIRDLTFRNRAFYYNGLYNLLEESKEIYPEKAEEFEKFRVRIGNSQKVVDNVQKGLMDPYLIARKKDFEQNIRDSVSSDPYLQEKYGHVWDSIADLRIELKPIEAKIAAYRQSRYFSAAYFRVAEKIIDYAERKKSSIENPSDSIKIVEPDSLLIELFPDTFDPIFENIKLQVQLDYIRLNLGNENELVQLLSGELMGREAVESLLERSFISERAKAADLLKKEPAEILNSSDPFIEFMKITKDQVSGLSKRSSEIKKTEGVFMNMLGKILFDIYGTDIPPDANFTLRISDGTLKTFDYNGTKAIEKTTFYGLYDRYFGSDKSYPWNLSGKWLNPPKDFDLSTTFNFISTNDIIGGNSGSAVINKEAEVVGLAFDGNIHSIIGNFIFLPEDNRMVSVASQGIVESLDKIYRADRIVKELKTGKIAN